MNDRDAALRRILACLGDSSRFRLVRTLVAGERCVTDLALDVGLSQSCTTRHLQALQREGLVCGERSGKRVLYRLCSNAADFGELLGWVAGTTDVSLLAPAELRATDGRSDAGETPARPVKPTGDPDHAVAESYETTTETEPTVLAYPRNDLEDYLL
jgi:DNA-binding transcriptional ArsR family regulator